jgi:hypothetical protein
MHTVHYTKHFLSGNLAGLTVPCTLRVPDSAHAQLTLERLARYTVSEPGRDCVTNARFWVSF